MSSTTGTRADSIQRYLTGASSDGGSQASDALSFGVYRSSTELQVRGCVITSAISNITVLFVSGANPVGAGTLTADTTGTLRWTPPGGTQGPSTTVNNGDTCIIESGNDPNQFVRVTRTSSASLTGTATLTLSDVLNNAIGQSNVSSAQASSGEDTYRSIMLKNAHPTLTVAGVTAYIGVLATAQSSDAGQLGASGAGTISTSGSFDSAGWPSTGFCHIKTNTGTDRELVYYSSRTATVLTIPSGGRGLGGTSAAAGASTDTLDAVPGIQIGIEAPTSSHLQTIANETSAPTGITWSIATTKATGVVIGNMAVGALYGLWIHRMVIPGEQATPVLKEIVNLAFDSA